MPRSWLDLEELAMQSKGAQVARSEISCNLKKCEGASGHWDYSPLNSIVTVHKVIIHGCKSGCEFA